MIVELEGALLHGRLSMAAPVTYKGTINGPNSFEQDPPPQTPRWVKRTPIRGHERVVTYVIVDSAAALVKSSGARGLHVVAFIKPEYEYRIFRQAAHR